MIRYILKYVKAFFTIKLVILNGVFAYLIFGREFDIDKIMKRYL